MVPLLSTPTQQAQDIKKIGRPAKHTFQTLQKAITVKRRLRKEDVNLKNVAKKPRLRQKTDRFSYVHKVFNNGLTFCIFLSLH